MTAPALSMRTTTSLSTTLAALTVLGLSSAACSSSSEAAIQKAGDRARQIIVALDRSGSRTQAEVDQDKELISALVHGLRGDDQIVLMEVAGGADRVSANAIPHTLPKVKDPRNPTKDERRRRDAVLEDANADLNGLFEARPSQRTDLLATLHIVRDYSLEAQGRQTTLILFSDMIQDAQHLNFERAGSIPGGTWITDQAKKKLIPELANMCITVVGADSSTALGVARRDFWATYFKTAKANFAPARYRRLLTLVESAFCQA